MRLIPRKLFLTRGVGVHREKLTSFEMALREAGIAHFNLVRVSSIFPPGCRIVQAEEGLPLLQAGEIGFAVIAEMSSNEPGRRIAASIGVALDAMIRSGEATSGDTCLIIGFGAGLVYAGQVITIP